MLDAIGSRRTVIGAGIGAGVVAGAAMLVPRAFRGGAGAGADDITVVPGTAPRFVDDPAELGRWAGMVGRPVRLGGSIGVIEAVDPVAVEGRLPAGVRRQPFSVRFALDPVGAPAGDAITDVGTTIEGLTRLFVQRGADRGGRAILTALFA